MEPGQRHERRSPGHLDRRLVRTPQPPATVHLDGRGLSRVRAVRCTAAAATAQLAGGQARSTVRSRPRRRLQLGTVRPRPGTRAHGPLGQLAPTRGRHPRARRGGPAGRTPAAQRRPGPGPRSGLGRSADGTQPRSSRTGSGRPCSFRQRSPGTRRLVLDSDPQVEQRRKGLAQVQGDLPQCAGPVLGRPGIVIPLLGARGSPGKCEGRGT